MNDVEKKILNNAIKKQIEAHFAVAKIENDNTPKRIACFYNGYQIVETNAITKEIQRRTHKKHRINKKWAKRYGYKTVPDDRLIIRSGSIICATPKAVKRLVSAMKGGAE
jgi:hypothetical protein